MKINVPLSLKYKEIQQKEKGGGSKVILSFSIPQSWSQGPKWWSWMRSSSIHHLENNKHTYKQYCAQQQTHKATRFTHCVMVLGPLTQCFEFSFVSCHFVLCLSPLVVPRLFCLDFILDFPLCACVYIAVWVLVPHFPPLFYSIMSIHVSPAHHVCALPHAPTCSLSCSSLRHCVLPVLLW